MPEPFDFGPLRESVPHGTLSGYQYWRCRCEACTAANALHGRRVRNRLRNSTPPPEAHGNVSTYRNWACRCEPCTKANAEAIAQFRQNRPKDTQ